MENNPSFIDKLDTDYISHHGIKGMKWGVRRYQDINGTLTPSGRKRQARKMQRQLNNLDRVKVQKTYEIDKYEKRASRRLARDQKKDYSNSRVPFREDAWRKRMTRDKKTIEWAQARKGMINAQTKKQTDAILSKCAKQKMTVETKETYRFVDTGWRYVSDYMYVPIVRPYNGGTKYKVKS